MNTSNRENAEIEKINDHFSNSEDIPSISKGVSRFIKPTLITILSLLCLSGGIVLHKIHLVDAKNSNSIGYTPTSSLTLLKESTSISTNPLKAITPISDITPTPTQNVSLDSAIANPTISADISTEATAELGSEIKEETEATSVYIPQQQTFLDGFGLKDALKFKENFLAENDCKEDYQKLLNVPNKTNEVLAVLNDLSPYCLNNQKPVQNVLNAFLKNKKEAIIVYYKHNNPAWLAYLKSIPISIIEIRRINPVKNTPKNILYKAQNELMVQNVENAVNLITTLPHEMQQKMDDFYREAAIYNRALQSLDQLILSFERKGE